MSRKKISMTVYLEPSQHDELRAFSAKTRVAMNAYVRDGVDLVLAKLRGELADWVAERSR